jgi:hypothetical protein
MGTKSRHQSHPQLWAIVSLSFRLEVDIKPRPNAFRSARRIQPNGGHG